MNNFCYSSDNNKPNPIKGTLIWAAPEILKQSSNLTTAVDVFSLGLIIGIC